MAGGDFPRRPVMRLGLCSSAAPDATLAHLFEACRRRGLTALELTDSDGHGLIPGTEAIVGAVAVGRGVAGDVEITGYRSTADGHDLWLARLSEALGAPILLDARSVVHARLSRAHGIMEVGGRVAVAIRGDGYLADAFEAAKAGIDVAWDVRPSLEHVGDRLAALLDVVGPRLRHVRILGGGPETASQEGHGIGAAMGRLALASYAGTIILAPSSGRYRVAWQSWLGRRGGWGCGSKASDAALVQLSSPALRDGAIC